MKQRLQKFIPRQPHQWFVACATVFGLLFLFITPPYHVPDEYGHMARAYGLSQGNILTMPQDGKSGSTVPVSMAVLGNTVYEGFAPADIPGLTSSIPLNRAHTMFIEHPNMVLYSPVVYTPQAVGLGVSHALELPAVIGFYLGRILNLAAYIGLLYLAIRLLPFGKWVAVIIGLLPMHISLAASLSADPVSIGLLAVLVGAVLRLRSLKRSITTKEGVLLVTLVAAVAVTKLPFPLLIVLLLFVPARVLGGARKTWWLWIAGIGATAAVAGLGWLFAAKAGLVPYGPEGVSVADQLHFLFGHPLTFIKALVLTLFTSVGDGFLAMYPLSINQMSAGLPLWLTYAYAVFVAFAAYPLRTAVAGTFSRWQKVAVAALAAMSVACIMFLLYVSWTPVGKGVVDGMQARYLTPYLFLLMPLLAMRSSKQNAQDGTLSVACYRIGTVFFLVASVLMAVYFFYFK